jgi:hypothetical protein
LAATDFLSMFHLPAQKVFSFKNFMFQYGGMPARTWGPRMGGRGLSSSLTPSLIRARETPLSGLFPAIVLFSQDLIDGAARA